MARWDRRDRVGRRRGASRSPGDDRDGAADPAPDASSDDVVLDGPEHAWWTQRELAEPWTPRIAAGSPDPLAVHLGDDWQHDFGFDDPTAPPPPEPDPAPPTGDDLRRPVDTSPYAVLGVDPSAPWEDIVAAHRRAVRRHHPDRVAGAGHGHAERARAEESIIAVNAAYQELRTRRGR